MKKRFLTYDIENAPSGVDEKGLFTGGGVTSWNDLTDKPFGEMPKVLYEDYPNFAFYSAVLQGVVLQEGITYKISIISGETALTGNSIAQLLNGQIVIDNTGEAEETPYMITYNPGENLAYLTQVGGKLMEGCPETDTEGVFAYTSKYKIKIEYLYEDDAGVKTIDSKYLPKAEAVANATGALTVDNFNALLEALRNAGYMNE